MILAGDIGGTKTRIALMEEGSSGLRIALEEVYRSGEHAGLEEIVGVFRRVHREPVESAGFGVAGPVRDGRAHTTNLPWNVDARKLATELSLPHVALLNDLEAMANGIAALSPSDLVCLRAGSPDARGNRAVIAAGTGLGQAGLFWDGREHEPFATEGGHADFAPPDDLQNELLWSLRGEFPRVEVEHVLSGPGLVRIFRFLVKTGRGDEPGWLAGEMSDGDPAAAISRAAIEGRSSTCEAALDLFVQTYGAQAGNFALAVMATGGVYIGGGIAPKILPKLQGPGFLEAFSGRPSMRELLESIPIHVILQERTPLFGAARSALRPRAEVTQPSGPQVRVFEGSGELALAARDEVLAAARSTLAESERFTMVLAGGSTPRFLYELLSGADLPWEKVHLFFSDERCVPPDHTGSNYRMVRESLTSKVSIPPGNVHRIRGELPSAERAAFEYEAELRAFFGTKLGEFPRFNLVLLGMGSEGHTASLFPGTLVLREKERLVAAPFVPKLASHRITLTLPVLNATAEVLFLVAGKHKAESVRSVLERDPAGVDLPARLVEPTDGKVVWLLDMGAASKLRLAGGRG